MSNIEWWEKSARAVFLYYVVHQILKIGVAVKLWTSGDDNQGIIIKLP
jgi:hypothetical protein